MARIISKIVPLVAALSLGVPIAEKEVHQKERTEKIEAAIDDEINNRTQRVQKQMAACIEDKNKPKSGKSFLQIYSDTEYTSAWFGPDIQQVQTSNSYSGTATLDTYACPTDAGTVYYGYQMDKDKYSCRDANERMFIAVPITSISSSNPKIKKKGDDVTRSLEPTLYHHIETNSRYGWGAKLTRSNTALIETLPDGTRMFVQIDLSDKTQKKLDAAEAPWSDFMDQTLQQKRKAENKALIDGELKAHHGKIEKLLEDYIQRLPLYEGEGVRQKDIQMVEKAKTLLFKRFWRFYQYVEKAAGPEKKAAFLKTLYRLLSCNPVRTTVENTPWRDYAGQHMPNSRKIKLDIAENSNNPEYIADTWLHEIIHAVTGEEGVKGIRNYDFSAQRMFTEGIAELSTAIANPTMMMHPKSWSRLEYADFSLLTAAFLGSEGYAESIIMEDGFHYNINNKFEVRLQKFMKRWKIDPRYQADLQRVFGDGDPFANLEMVKIDEKREKRRWLYSGERLYVLKDMLRQNGIQWDRFLRETSKDFGIPPIRNSFHYGYY